MGAAPASDTELQQALQWHRQGRLAEAIALYEAVLRRSPATLEALQMLGLAHVGLQQAGAALPYFERATQLAPDSAAAHFNRGLTLLQLDRVQEALAALEATLARDPRHLKAWWMKGTTLHGQRDFEGALAAFRQLLLLDPDNADALLNSGTTLLQLQRPADALDCLQRALRLSPGAADVHFNLGVAYAALGRHQDAVGQYDAALRTAPGLLGAWINRGAAHLHLQRHDAAIRDLRHALSLHPAHPDVLGNLGNALAEAGHLPEAIVAFEQLLAVDPQRDFLRDALLQARMRLGDWTGFEAARTALERAAGDGPRVVPARLFAVSDLPLLQRRCAESYAAIEFPPRGASPALPVRRDARRLRIGYFSSDFHAHATAFLMARVFELHDRNRFEPIAYAWGHPPADAMHQRLRGAFDAFHDASALGDGALAELARGHQLDVAVDLKGLSQGGRPRVFAQRVAPLQLAYLGYPMTLGSPCIDYLVADRSIVPADRRAHYTEKILALPHVYQANDDTRPIAPLRLTRALAGLPEVGFVFCAFNSIYKITPEVFGVWMRLLQQVPGSVLWLLAGHPAATGNLQREAQARGVAPERLVWAPVASPEDHLARHALADLFLDTLPCNAHTTASDALWAGLPLVTCEGEAFAGRVAASLVRAAGLPELATASLADYEALALALSREPGRLRELRARLNDNRARCALFDSARFTRHLERGYEMIHARAAEGLLPDHVDIPSL